ncbi:MAG TPA: hypothetical protein VIN10_06710 [Bacteroidales bacterium]
MTFRYKLLPAIFLFALAAFLFSCKKQNTTIDYNPAVAASNEFVANQQLMTQILNTYFKSLYDSTLWAQGYAEIDGAVVSIEDTPVVLMKITYPWWGNHDGYGHFRMGVIEAIPETDFVQPDVLVNFNFIDFYYDHDTIEVSKMTVQQVENTAQNIYKYEVKVDSAVVIYADTSGQNSFNMYQTFRLKKDPATEYTSLLDKIYITGIMDGITLDLTSYSALVADSAEIIDMYDCRWLKNGPSELQVNGFQYPAFIYFPEPDSCINQYLVEIDDNPFPFPFDISY